jgi:hypothetical protein
MRQSLVSNPGVTVNASQSREIRVIDPARHEIAADQWQKAKRRPVDRVDASSAQTPLCPGRRSLVAFEQRRPK